MTDFNPKSVLLMKFTEEVLPDVLAFDCGDSETNGFFHDEAFAEQERGLNATTLLYYNGILAACISMCCDAIPLNKEEEGSPQATLMVPAIKLRYGVDLKFQDYDLDSFIIDFAKNTAFELASSKVGVRFVTTDVPFSREEFYAGKGFVRNKSGETGSIVSMRADIFEC